MAANRSGYRSPMPTPVIMDVDTGVDGGVAAAAMLVQRLRALVKARA
jgi:hypothetical protein